PIASQSRTRPSLRRCSRYSQRQNCIRHCCFGVALIRGRLWRRFACGGSLATRSWCCWTGTALAR
ncbi:hypothetical protein IWW38_005551, partial [Coemansia aciculifera]